MMGKCLVVKLQEVVDDPNLDILGKIKVPFNGNIHLLVKTSRDVEIELVGANGICDDATYQNPQTYDTWRSSWFNMYISSNGPGYLIIPEDAIINLGYGNDNADSSKPTSFDLDAARNLVNVQSLLTYDNTADYLTGNIESLVRCVSMTGLGGYFSSVEGTIEKFVAGQYKNGRTSCGSIVIGCSISSDKGITFDGLRFPSTWYLSWAPNSGNAELIDVTASGTNTAFDRTITIDINGFKVD